MHDVIGFANTYALDSAIQCLNTWGQGGCYVILKKFSSCQYIVIVGNDLSTEYTQNSNIHNDIAPVKTALNYTC